MGNPMETRGGKRPGAGRPPGSPGKLNGAFREAVTIVYNDMGGHEAFTKWARKNQTEFYRIASRLIPVEVHGTSDRTINVYVNRSTPKIIEAEALSLAALSDRSEPNDDEAHDAV